MGSGVRGRRARPKWSSGDPGCRAPGGLFAGCGARTRAGRRRAAGCREHTAAPRGKTRYALPTSTIGSCARFWTGMFEVRVLGGQLDLIISDRRAGKAPVVGRRSSKPEAAGSIPATRSTHGQQVRSSLRWETAAAPGPNPGGRKAVWVRVPPGAPARPERPSGRVARRRPAKPFTPVRIRSWTPGGARLPHSATALPRSSAGRASDCYSDGRRFDPCRGSDDPAANRRAAVSAPVGQWQATAFSAPQRGFDPRQRYGHMQVRQHGSSRARLNAGCRQGLGSPHVLRLVDLISPSGRLNLSARSVIASAESK